jgi:Ras GTPase-activating-like protein IQGAP2/3
MVYSQSTVRGSRGAHTTKSPSPLRHTATISDSEDEDVPRRGVVSPSRASTYTTNTQYGTTQSRPGHRRGISDISPTKTFPAYEPTNTSPYTSPTRQSRAPTRQTLGDLSQATNVIVPVPSLTHGSVHSRAQSFDAAAQKAPVVSQRSSEREASGLGRAHSRRVVADDQNGRGGDYAHSAQPVHLDNGDLEKLGRSTTGHLKTLSKLAETGVEEDFTIRTKDQAVVGLQGRRRLQGNMSMKERTLHAPGYGGRIWMDQQRQYLQAYEYLCHIGEAKEWIQDVMGQEIPPIVQLEEHLRDGVTLAEIVQSLYPQKTLRIYRNPRLQYRHSDNIAIFFNFLAEVELPELFRFELVDLYEKKNIPKVIYCIHALSWLLFRKGIVDFKIGNLVGQLEFEQHELENMQKGLDQSGVSMPNFSGLRPEPVEPVETEEDRIDRELRQHDEATIEFQAQLRGALQRLQLGEIVQALGDHEDAIVDLQARLRGGWSRQIHDYQLSRRQFAVKLQSIARGYLVRTDQRERTQDWRDHEKDIVRIQAIVRARQSRKQTRQLKSQTSQHERGVIDIQAAIRGAMRRLQLGEHYNDVHDSHDSVTELQKHVRGMLTRRNHARRAGDLENLETAWTKLQSHARGFLVRKSRQASRAELVGHTAVITSLQTQIRAQQVRRAHLKQKEEIATLQAPMLKLQSAARTFLLQKVVKQDLEKVTKSSESIIAIQAQARGCIYRAKLFDQLEDFKENEEQIVELQASVRGTLARFRMTDDFQALVAAEDSIVEAQTLFRAKAILKAHKEKERFFKENMQKVVKIQSIFRGRQQGQAYKSLTSGKNPPVGTVKNFVHLLNDSDFDFEEEFGK